MRRSQAERAVSDSRLTMSERAVMMMLLRRADNDDCSVIPEWNTPTIRALASEIPVTERRLRRILQHLAKHGWLEYTPGCPGRQPAKSSGKGKGRFRPLPRKPDPCLPPCEGVHRARKRGFQNPLSAEENGSQNPLKKGVPVHESAQVIGQIPPRDSVTRGVVAGKPPLTVVIAGRTHPAIICRDCGVPVPEEFAFDGCHATCEAG